MSRMRTMTRGILGLAAVTLVAALAPAAAQADQLAAWGPASLLTNFVSGVAVSADGQVYVADMGTSRISVFTREGTKLRDFGGVGLGPAGFLGLSGVAVGPDGSVYASDVSSVQKFTADGEFVKRWGGWGDHDGEFRGTGGVAVDQQDGTVYVTDRGGRRVEAFDADGAFKGVVVQHGDEVENHAIPRHLWAHGHEDGIDLDDPRGIAVAADHSLVIAEGEDDRVFHTTRDGDLLHAWDSSRVNGVAIDPTDGTVLATDKSGHVVHRTQIDGTPVGAVGDGHLNSPNAVATDCRGAAYVADRGSKRMHVFGAEGLLSPPCVTAPEPPAPPAGPARAQEPDPVVQVAGIVIESPKPQLGKSGVAQVTEGTVRVRKPGESKFEKLLSESVLPVGTTIDATNGHVRITFQTAPEDIDVYGPTQFAEFWGGEFRFFQAASGSLVDVILTGQQPDCSDPAVSLSRARTSASKKGSRFVWGKGKGKFRTTGNNGAATVRGTTWYTQDRCDGTYFKTKEGVVDVSDFGEKKTVPVKAGQKYLARAPCTSRRAFQIRLLVPVGTPVSEARVFVNGKKVKVGTDGRRPTAKINLNGRPKQRVRVRITVKLANGQVLSGKREYQTCTPRLPSAPPKL